MYIGLIKACSRMLSARPPLKLIWISAYCRDLQHTRVLFSMFSYGMEKRIYFFLLLSVFGLVVFFRPEGGVASPAFHSLRLLDGGGVYVRNRFLEHVVMNCISFIWLNLTLRLLLSLFFYSNSSLPGWMRSSLSSAWRAKQVSTPSTLITLKWRSIATQPKSPSSSSALKVRYILSLTL